jgi:protein-tyrosine phosphatase
VAEAQLRGGAIAVVHCAAGIHRTGLVGYALCRRSGLEHDEAIRAIIAERPVCADSVRFIQKLGKQLC